jgi:adenylate cyclase class 2
MADSGKEIEVKFLLSNLEALEFRLKDIGALCVQPRTYETNLRFDTPDRELTRTFQILRLRQDSAARVTYKGPGEEQGGASLRQEIEITVSDFTIAQSLFEALGYQVVFMYEKYRTAYALDEVVVTLDEMPFGNFTEVEGPDGDRIHECADQLGLVWEVRNLDSYQVLFDRVQAALDLTFRDMSFENFKEVKVPADAFGMRFADA